MSPDEPHDVFPKEHIMFSRSLHIALVSLFVSSTFACAQTAVNPVAAASEPSSVKAAQELRVPLDASRERTPKARFQ